MSKKCRATDEDWEAQEKWELEDPYARCLLELRSRVEVLERRCDVQLQQLTDLQDRHRRLAGSVRLLEGEVIRDQPEPPTLATDQELCQLYDQTGPTIVDAFRAIYDLGRQQGAQAAPATEESSAPAPAGSLVERVRVLLGHHGDGTARAAIREVAAWLRTGRLLHAAELLEQEADR